jgi:RHS repeat-associated protein
MKSFAYTWNGEKRLIKAEELVAPTNRQPYVVSYAYDYRGRMIWKTIAPSTGSPIKTTTYVWDDYNIIAEHTTTAETTNSTYNVWGLDLSGTLQGAGGVGGLLAVHTSPLPLGEGQGEGGMALPCYDNNGNITAYLDDSGTVVAEYTNDAFGRTISQSGPLASAFPHRFSTKYHDPETGLYYYGYRFYSPTLMRWLNRDPIEEEGGVNPYAICSNNTVSAFDVLGLTEFSIGLFWRTLSMQEWLEIEQLQISIAETCKQLIANINNFRENHFPQAREKPPHQYAQPREIDKTSNLNHLDTNLVNVFHLNMHRNAGTLNWALQHITSRLEQQKFIETISSDRYRMSCKINPAQIFGIAALKTPLFMGFLKPSWEKLTRSEKRGLLGHETSHWLHKTGDYYYRHPDKVIFDAYAWGFLFDQ